MLHAQIGPDMAQVVDVGLSLLREVDIDAGHLLVLAERTQHPPGGVARHAPADERSPASAPTRLTYAARNLGGRRTGLISISLAQDDGHYFAYFLQLVRAATEAAVESGYALVLSSEVAGSGSRLETLTVDGGIVIDPVRNDPHVARLRAAGAALVTTGRVPDEEGGCWVDNDHPRGLCRLLDHLAERGAQRVALIGIPQTTTYAIETRETYDAWCAARGQEPIIEWADGDLTEAAGYSATESLSEAATPPDAICAPLDRLALGALLYARVTGVAIPDGMLVACVTNGESTRAARPSLTALELYPERIGAGAVEMLVDLIEGRAAAAPGHAVRVALFCHCGRPVAEPDLFDEMAAGVERVRDGEAELVPAVDIIGTPMLEARFDHFSVTVTDPEAEQAQLVVGD